jgi:hypothetical protein
MLSTRVKLAFVVVASVVVPVLVAGTPWGP